METETLAPYWLVTTAVHFWGSKVDKWSPTARVCLSYKDAEKRAEIDRRDSRCAFTEISGPFYQKMPRSAP